MADIAKIHGSIDPTNDAEWFQYHGTDIKFLIAPWENPYYRQSALKAAKINTDDSNDNEIPKNQYEFAELGAKRLVEGKILLDWENIQVEGEPWEFSDDKAVILLRDYEPIGDFVVNKSQELRDKLKKNLETNKKKSRK